MTRSCALDLQGGIFMRHLSRWITFLSSLCLPLHADLAPETSKPCISARMRGELGNQLFEIATAYALARDHGWDYSIPDLLSNRFNCIANHQQLLYRVPVHACPQDGAYNEYAWTRYEELPSWPGMVLNGYFQSERYFARYRDEILALFAFREGHWETLTALYPELLEEEKIAVQVRVNYDAYHDYASVHPTFGELYFERAIADLPEGALYVVTSNHIGAAKKILSGIQRRFLFLEKTDRFDDLLIMSRCEHLIGSNSTLAWWGAWLGDREGRRCIFPFPWHAVAPTRAHAPHLIPERWEVIECPEAMLLKDPTPNTSSGYKRSFAAF